MLFERHQTRRIHRALSLPALGLCAGQRDARAGGQEGRRVGALGEVLRTETRSTGTPEALRRKFRGPLVELNPGLFAVLRPGTPASLRLRFITGLPQKMLPISAFLLESGGTVLIEGETVSRDMARGKVSRSDPVGPGPLKSVA